VFYKQGKVDQSIAEWEVALQIDPDTPKRKTTSSPRKRPRRRRPREFRKSAKNPLPTPEVGTYYPEPPSDISVEAPEITIQAYQSSDPLSKSIVMLQQALEIVPTTR